MLRATGPRMPSSLSKQRPTKPGQELRIERMRMPGRACVSRPVFIARDAWIHDFLSLFPLIPTLPYTSFLLFLPCPGCKRIWVLCRVLPHSLPFVMLLATFSDPSCFCSWAPPPLSHVLFYFPLQEPCSGQLDSQLIFQCVFRVLILQPLFRRDPLSGMFSPQTACSL